MKPRPPETEQLVEEALQLTRKRGLLMEVKVLEDPIKPPKPLAYYRWLLGSVARVSHDLFAACILWGRV